MRPVYSPGSIGGIVSKSATNVSGWPSSITTSRMSGVATGSRPRSRSAVADDARNQVVRDVVQNLVLVALPDDGRRHLALPEARDARGLE